MNKLLFKQFFAFSLFLVTFFAFSSNPFAETYSCNYSAQSNGKKYVASFSIKKEIRQDRNLYKPINFRLYNGTQYITPTIQFPKESLNIKDDKCPDVVLYYVDQDNNHNVMIGSLSDTAISTIMNYANSLPTRVILNSFVSNPKPSQKPDDSTINNNDKNSDNSNDDGYILNYDGDVCANENVKNAVKLVGKVISIIQIAVPIILIIMALVDIAKSIISMDDSKSKKSVNHLIKRLISAVLIFFIIAIVRFVCQLIVGDSMESCLGLIANPW